MIQAFRAMAFALANSDFFSSIIIILLAVMSVYSWILMFEKWAHISTAFSMNRRFFSKFRESSGVLHMANNLEAYRGAPLMEIYRSAVCEMMEVLDLSDRRIKECCQTRRIPRGFREYELQRVRAMMERAVADKIIDLEAKMNSISTIISLAPFMGLLGTVIGITVTLCSAAMNGGRMDFSVVGPGICGALLTTILGLLVAIPALVGSNIIIGKLRETTVGMETFIEEFMTALNLQSVETEKRQEAAQQLSGGQKTDTVPESNVANGAPMQSEYLFEDGV